MKELTIFKIEYSWYEGEYSKTYLAKDVDLKTFEKDLIEARNFAQSLIGKEVEHDYLGKGYSVECRPEYYEQIIWYLINKLEYFSCSIEKDVTYDVDDDVTGNNIVINKFVKSIERTILIE